MSGEVRIGPVELTGADVGFIVQVLEQEYRSERARVWAFKGQGDESRAYMSSLAVGQLEDILRKFGWKGPRKRKQAQ